MHQNDQCVTAIILRYICWGTVDPPPHPPTPCGPVRGSSHGSHPPWGGSGKGARTNPPLRKPSPHPFTPGAPMPLGRLPLRLPRAGTGRVGRAALRLQRGPQTASPVAFFLHSDGRPCPRTVRQQRGRDSAQAPPPPPGAQMMLHGHGGAPHWRVPQVRAGARGKRPGPNRTRPLPWEGHGATGRAVKGGGVARVGHRAPTPLPRYPLVVIVAGAGELRSACGHQREE